MGNIHSQTRPRVIENPQGKEKEKGVGGGLNHRVKCSGFTTAVPHY